jgi:aerobic carbon-monoxide dehydrogenase small subunit
MKNTFQFTLNHKPTRLEADGQRMLLWVLRTDLGLTGSKFGCGEGFCGACTVLLNGEAVRSCQVPLGSVNGAQIITVEGLSQNGDLHPLQKAFIAYDAMQCGYCTSGMLMNAYGLLLKNPQPTRAEIVESMDGNLCRCGTYARIIEAVEAAARDMKAGTK